MTIERTASLRPGHNPPQVTIPHFSMPGWKKIRALGPASSNDGGSTPASRYPRSSSRSSRYSTRSSASMNRVSRRGEGTVHSPRSATMKSEGGCVVFTCPAKRGRCSPCGLAARDVGDLGDVSPHLAEFVGEVPPAFAEGRIIGADEPAVPGQLQRRPEHLGRDGLLAGQPVLQRPLPAHAQAPGEELLLVELLGGVGRGQLL